MFENYLGKQFAQERHVVLLRYLYRHWLTTLLCWFKIQLVIQCKQYLHRKYHAMCKFLRCNYPWNSHQQRSVIVCIGPCRRFLHVQVHSITVPFETFWQRFSLVQCINFDICLKNEGKHWWLTYMEDVSSYLWSASEQVHSNNSDLIFINHLLICSVTK